ncbi:MAG: multiple antibiotic resistance protein [Crocinitomicaceae bacterium]|jgi:multiple antibiotic resistance protein
MELFFLSFGALFSVINPLGTLPIFIGLTNQKDKKVIIETAIRTAINMLVILLIAYYLGRYMLFFFGISLQSLKIGGGIIIATSGFALLTGSFSKHKGMGKRVKDDAFTRSDISLTPLAIPMLAGPGSISLLISFKDQYNSIQDQIVLNGAILTVSVITCLLLISSRVIVKRLGASGINALSRIIGFIVISIGVEYVLSTVLEIIETIR